MRTTLVYLCALLPLRLLCARWAPIADCDETFNYWEPLHYLLPASSGGATPRAGMQTWEYSPDYALRSYTYLELHGLMLRAGQLSVYQRPALLVRLELRQRAVSGARAVPSRYLCRVC